MAHNQGDKETGRPGDKQNGTFGPSPGVVGGLSNPTRILALETSGRDASVAVLEAVGGDARLLREVTLSGMQRTAQILAPGVRDLLDAHDWAPASIQLVAVAIGPGSFTGLRIGVTMAKTFAYAVGAQVIGVNTLAVLAEQARHLSGPLWTVMDAQRQELYAAKFVDGVGSETRIVGEVDWLAALQPGDRVTGPALRKLQPRLPAGVEVVDASLWQPLAKAVGVVGWREFQAGRRDDVWKLAPHYYRQSAAEEKAAKKRNS